MKNRTYSLKESAEKTLFVLCLGMAALLFARNREAERLVFDYLRFCVERIVPSLFLFLVVSDLICASPIFVRICRKVPVFGTELLLLVLGTLGGFPLGARVCASLYGEGKVRKKEAEYLLCFSNNASVSFTVGFVGQNVFGSRAFGIKLFGIQVLAALCCAVLFRFVIFSKGERGRIRGVADANVLGKGKSFVKAVLDGASTMIGICAFIVVFGVLGALVCGELNQSSNSVLRGVFEFSSGISLCAQGGGGEFAVPCAMILGWAGFCVHCQVASAVGGKLSLKPYFLSKLFQCALMGLLTWFLL